MGLFCLLAQGTWAALPPELTGSFTPLERGSLIDLSSQGSADWAHWGLDSSNFFNQSLVSTSRISNFALIGPSPAQQQLDSGISYMWTNGTPVESVRATTSGMVVLGLGNGFSLTAPADTTLRRLNIYLGVFAAQGTFHASLSDSSAPAYTDLSLVDYVGSTNGVYSIQYRAASAGQTLNLQFTASELYDETSGEVSLQAATLALIKTNYAPSVTLVSPTNGSIFTGNGIIPLSVSASDSDGFIAHVDFFSGSTLIAEGMAPAFTNHWSSVPPGSYTLQAVATDDLGLSSTSAPVSVTVTASGSSLSGAVASVPGTVDLTTEGRLDWAHWGFGTETSFDHKAGVNSLISDYSIVGYGPAYPYSDNPTGFSWSDGTPTAAAVSTPTGVYVVGLSNGFRLHCPADQSPKTLKVYVGAYGAGGRLGARFTELGTPVYTDSSINNIGNGPGAVYSLTFQSAFAGSSLVVTYTVEEMYDLGYGNVTLQAATLVGDNDPPIAQFSYLTNGSAFHLGSSIPIDIFGSDPDGSITNLELFADGTRLAASPNATLSFTWTNATLGAHALTARATDNMGATYATQPLTVYVVRPGGILSGSVTNPPQVVDLTTQGRKDWGHWALANRRSYDHKKNVPSVLNTLAALGANQMNRYDDNYTLFSWSDGTPTLASLGTRTGLYVSGNGSGFQITLPAGTNLTVARFYVGLYGARGRLEARLSDWSAAAYVDASISRTYGNGYAVYTLRYAAASTNQTLLVKWTAEHLFDSQYGNVTWQSATLADLPVAPLLAILQTESGPALSFPSDTNWTYTILGRDSLVPSPWISLTNFMGTGSAVLWPVPDFGSGTSRFYRLKVE